MSLIKVTKTNCFDKWLVKLKDRQARTIILTHIKRIECDNLGIVRSVGHGVYEKRSIMDQGTDFTTYNKEKHGFYSYAEEINPRNKKTLIWLTN